MDLIERDIPSNFEVLALFPSDLLGPLEINLSCFPKRCSFCRSVLIRRWRAIALRGLICRENRWIMNRGDWKEEISCPELLNAFKLQSEFISRLWRMKFDPFVL